MFKRFALSLVVVCSFANATETGAMENPGRFAAVSQFFSNCWNSQATQFSCDMINPAAYGRACKAMVAAGFKGALPELYDNHKAVIVGSAVFTTAAVVAYYKGWFKQAQEWVSAKLA